jgi:hypothetical protein
MTHAGQLALLRRLSGSPAPRRTSSSPTSPPKISAPITPNPAAPTRTGPRNLRRKGPSSNPECRAVDLSRCRLQLAKQNRPV